MIMRPGMLVAFWLLVLGATSIRVDTIVATPGDDSPEAVASAQGRP